MEINWKCLDLDDDNICHNLDGRRTLKLLVKHKKFVFCGVANNYNQLDHERLTNNFREIWLCNLQIVFLVIELCTFTVVRCDFDEFALKNANQTDFLKDCNEISDFRPISANFRINFTKLIQLELKNSQWNPKLILFVSLN